MKVKSKRLADTLQILEKNRQSTPGTVEILGHNYQTSPEVFSPRHFLDTAIFVQAIVELVKPGDTFCEIGCGSGVISIEAALAGVTVTTVDLNTAACELTRQNARANKVNIQIYQGDIFASLPSDQRFTWGFWNHPFAWVPSDYPLDMLQRAVADPEYEATERFIREGRSRFATLLLGTSPELAHIGYLRELFRKYGLRPTVVYEVWSQEVRPVRFQVLAGIFT